MFFMNAEKQLKIDVISKVCDGRFDVKMASQILQKSERTIFNYLKEYKENGVVFVVHGNIGKIPVNKTSETLKEKVMDLVLNKYDDFNMLHCLEKLEEMHSFKLNREVFRSWCHEKNHVKKAHKRKPKARYLRQRMASEGLLLQMDGSPHKWFGNKESCLIAILDDANSEIIYGEFFPAEDTISCMRVLQKAIEKKGLFEILYVDRAGIFGGPKRCKFSHVKNALDSININTIYANSAEAKGRIERLFNTLQDRLIPEMRLRNIKSYEAANSFLQEQFIPNVFNKKFTVTPRSLQSSYKPLPKEIKLKEVLCMKEHRIVNKDHTISFNSQKYAFTSPVGYSIRKQKIEIRTYQDLTWKAFYAGKEIELENVSYFNKQAA